MIVARDVTMCREVVPKGAWLLFVCGVIFLYNRRGDSGRRAARGRARQYVFHASIGALKTCGCLLDDGRSYSVGYRKADRGALVVRADNAMYVSITGEVSPYLACPVYGSVVRDGCVDAGIRVLGREAVEATPPHAAPQCLATIAGPRTTVNVVRAGRRA